MNKFYIFCHKALQNRRNFTLRQIENKIYELRKILNKKLYKYLKIEIHKYN